MRAFCLVLALPLAGCLGALVPDIEPALDEQAVHSDLASGAFRGSRYVKLTPIPLHTTVNETDWVDVFITRAAATAYLEALVRQPRIDSGTVIVRAVLDEAGAMKKLTVMAKAPAGYYPDGGDWLYAVTAPDGTPLPDEAGQAQWGRLSDCAACHEGRRDHGWLFGLPEKKSRELPQRH